MLPTGAYYLVVFSVLTNSFTGLGSNGCRWLCLGVLIAKFLHCYFSPVKVLKLFGFLALYSIKVFFRISGVLVRIFAVFESG